MPVLFININSYTRCTFERIIYLIDNKVFINNQNIILPKFIEKCITVAFSVLSSAKITQRHSKLGNSKHLLNQIGNCFFLNAQRVNSYLSLKVICFPPCTIPEALSPERLAETRYASFDDK